MRKTTFATLVCGAALAMGGHTAAAGSLDGLPPCRGAAGSNEQPPCRLGTDVGILDTSAHYWTSSGIRGKDFKEWLPALPENESRETQSKVLIRAITPLGTGFRGEKLTYTVQVDVSPFGDTSQLLARLWLADDQGQYAVPVRDWKSKPFGGNGTHTFTIEAEGKTMSFQPAFLYLELQALGDVRTSDGIVPGTDFQVENVRVGMRPTAAR